MTQSQTWLQSNISRICSDLQQYLDGRQLDVDALETYELRLELIYREVVAIEILHSRQFGVQSHLRQALSIVRDMILVAQRREDGYYQAPINCDGSVGRPPFQVPRTQLSQLLSMCFTVPQISGILGVSVRTLRRRMSDYRLSVRSFYSDISDSTLEELVRHIQEEFPGCGNRQMQGHLISRGVRVQQRRVREAQRRTDPMGSALRRLTAIRRRRYRVGGPGALWHIDGNHKLIRYVHRCYCPPLENGILFYV